MTGAQFGQLALEHGGEKLMLRVCQSRAGFYLGTLDKHGFPYSRESQEYFPDHEAASTALASGAWTQRKHL